MGIIDEAGILALATRLQRLSDMMRKDGLQIYKDHGIAFEPKWFPVIYTLHHKPFAGCSGNSNRDWLYTSVNH
jgi:hypothetical protein